MLKRRRSEHGANRQKSLSSFSLALFGGRHLISVNRGCSLLLQKLPHVLLRSATQKITKISQPPCSTSSNCIFRYSNGPRPRIPYSHAFSLTSPKETLHCRRRYHGAAMAQRPGRGAESEPTFSEKTSAGDQLPRRLSRRSFNDERDSTAGGEFQSASLHARRRNGFVASLSYRRRRACVGSKLRRRFSLFSADDG